MNSISDFTELRPDVDAPTVSELDALWERVTGVEAGDGGACASPVDGGSRRWVGVLGAAASIVLGVAALAVLTGNRSTDDEAAKPTTLPTDPEVSPFASSDTARTTAPVASIRPPSDLEAAAAALSVEVELDAWLLNAAETVNPGGTPGGQWHYRSPQGQHLDIALYPGGEAGFHERTRWALVEDGGELMSAGDFVQIMRFSSPIGDAARYRLMGLLDLAGRDFTIEIELDLVDDAQLFYEIASTIAVVDGVVGERVAIADLVDDTVAATLAPGPNGAAAYVVGDMVALGAFQELNALGIGIDAQASRQFTDGADVIDDMLERGLVGGSEAHVDTVVIHLGSNGLIDPDHFTRTVEALSDVPTVVLVTSSSDRGWTASNNALLLAAAAQRPNVEVLDWASLASECPGECFSADQIHLSSAGAAYYASLVNSAIVD